MKRTTNIPIDQLDDLLDYLTDKLNELTFGDMPDNEGICYDIHRYITFLESLKLIYGVCDVCGNYIAPDETYSVINEQLICSECNEEI